MCTLPTLLSVCHPFEVEMISFGFFVPKVKSNINEGYDDVCLL